MKLHPLCTLFPRMEGAEFEALKNDIKANGQRSPIVMLNGMVLDGGNRFRACEALGIEPETVEFSGSSIVAFVLSANLHRRHMTTGQQAAIVASATDWEQAHPIGRIKGEGLHLSTSAERAAISGATTRTQKDADKLARENPAAAKQVAQGKKSLYKAVQELKPAPDPEPQREGPSEDELAVALHAEADDAAAVQALLAANEPMAHLMAENKRLTALTRSLELRITGLINEKDAAVRSAKSWQAKAERAMKQAA